MSIFSGKKFLLIGFIVVLLVAIPVTIYLVQQQQKTRSGAQPATKLTLTPASTSVNVGESVTLAFNVDPGTNQVSTIKFKLIYDSTKLSTTDAGFEVKSYRAADGTNFTPNVLAPGITYTDGAIQGVITVGPSPQYAISTLTQIASVTFKVIAPTEASPSTVSFDVPNTQVLSVGGESSAGENVLSSTIPASIIATGTAPTETPTPTIAIPTPTLAPTTAPTATPTPVVTNQSPVCNELSLSASGSAIPIVATLIANGTDADGTINKVTFNFGDGTTQDVTEGGGIGSNSVNISTQHTYNSAGTFTASAVLSDNSGNQSSSSTCNQTVTVSGGEQAAVTPTPVTVATSPAPTLPPTGPGQTVLFVGAFGAIMSAIGIFLLLAL